MEATYYQQALHDIRAKLSKRRGYATRIVQALNNKPLRGKQLVEKQREVYNVAWGRIKNPVILQALIKEAEAAQTHTDPSIEIISNYLSSVA
ncbi:hypothetical protein Q4E40_02880 [Pontibacter sp. BT731]|uniref:hypothetical protein n=1 Tax=Pontibacter coccineus TaxID=3063328 RepID=UPI0026E3673F|nr:hypothetical protein [Pontibacter sp. BT731]MDO6389058.1 hypothetical protein [Pontibacter sp. BT731]